MKSCVLATLTMVSLISAAVCARAGETVQPSDASGTVHRLKNQAARAAPKPRPIVRAPLDRVADAVDGAESSHGEDPTMWRPDPIGPQGPMQVTEAAATDVGGGDRFDTGQNRAIGRAYLAQLYWRYKNWPDAIAAYNWGIGNLDAWVKAGRPPDRFLTAVAAYTRRVLHDSGLCEAPAAEPVRGPPRRTPSASPQERQTAAEGEASGDTFEQIVCRDLANWGGAPDGLDRQSFGFAPNRFYSKLEKALRLALQHLPTAEHLARGGDDLVTARWSMAGTLKASSTGAALLRQPNRNE
jgi:hypothetical protein